MTSRRQLLSTALVGGIAGLSLTQIAHSKQKTPLPSGPVSDQRRVLIQSSSRYHTSGYLDFAKSQYDLLFDNKPAKILFIPFAKVAGTYDDYEKQVQAAFKPWGHEIISIHHFADPKKAVNQFDAIAVGGGNTWALTTRLYEAGIVDLIRTRVNAGKMRYCGWSAGGNIAGPTLRTTNDMPIAEPPTFNTFGFIPFQTNPHFISGGTPGLNNETREDRLEEFLYYNPDEEVIGLPEGTALYLTGQSSIQVLGPKDAEALYWFRQKPKPMTLERIALGTTFNAQDIRPGAKLTR